MNKKTVLITGASSGIGRELAKVYAGEGWDLVLSARRTNKLEELGRELSAAGSVSTVIPADLTDPGAPERIYDDITNRGIQIDLLINNAGFGLGGEFLSSDIKAVLGMLQVNIVALTALTRLFLPDMIKRGDGGIINVASTAAFIPIPLMAAYGASKSYVLSFSEALAEETRGSGVVVTALCPGPTITEFAKGAGIEGSLLFRLFGMDVRKVAEAAYRGHTRKKALVVPGLLNKLQAFLFPRISPRSLLPAAAGRLLVPPH
jgi:hypothetical protein